jgi:arylsulfatase A-like enzyme
MYGTNAIELQDTYLRLDNDLSEFLNYLDETVGKNNYLLFLTAYHGAVSNPLYNKDHHIPGGEFDSDTVFTALDSFLAAKYGPGKFISHSNARQIYLDRKLLDEKKIDAKKLRDQCALFVKQFDGVAEAITCDELQRENCREGIASFIQNGYNDKRSADVLIELRPGWIDWYTHTGTTHGSAYSYDTHVPLLFFGTGIPHGSANASVTIADIAPTIAALLGIENPSGTSGKQLKDIMK